MKHRTWSVVLALVLMVTIASSALAGDDADKAPKLSVKADLELFYEMSDDIKGSGDNDKFKSNQLYLDFQGKFENDTAAKLKIDAADIVSGNGKSVTEKVVEEANFTAKHIGGSPVTLVFGKDEMPFGMDYDKYLNDSIAHQFEIDKVWGLHGIVDIACVGSLAAAVYQHRHSETGEVDPTNEAGDNFTARLTIDKLVKNLKVKLSGANESYSNVSSTDSDGVTTATDKNDETRLGVGAVYKIKGLGNVNAEYVAFSNLKGTPDYDPSIVTIGVQCDVIEKTAIWARLEIIDEDTDDAVENNFWSVGVKYSPTKNYSVMVEHSNFNSGDVSDAKDLKVADGSIESSTLIGVRAKF